MLHDVLTEMQHAAFIYLLVGISVNSPSAEATLTRQNQNNYYRQE